MAEILPFRRPRQWTRARDYGVPNPTRRRGGGKRGGGGWRKAARELGPTLWALPLAVAVAVFFALAPDMGQGGFAAAATSPLQSGSDTEQARFAKCGPFASREACVVDGDTFWYRGAKIRVADINTPETGGAKCAHEADPGARATARLTELLNAGAFTLEPVDRAHDKYGRALFTVTRGGQSVGAALVREGLAEKWQGYRREWC